MLYIYVKVDVGINWVFIGINWHLENASNAIFEIYMLIFKLNNLKRKNCFWS